MERECARSTPCTQNSSKTRTSAITFPSTSTSTATSGEVWGRPTRRAGQESSQSCCSQGNDIYVKQKLCPWCSQRSLYDLDAAATGREIVAFGIRFNPSAAACLALVRLD